MVEETLGDFNGILQCVRDGFGFCEKVAIICNNFSKNITSMFRAIQPCHHSHAGCRQDLEVVHVSHACLMTLALPLWYMWPYSWSLMQNIM